MGYWVAIIGEEVDAPAGRYDTLEEAKARCDELFASAVPAATPFAFCAYNPDEQDIAYMTDEVKPTKEA